MTRFLSLACLLFASVASAQQPLSQLVQRSPHVWVAREPAPVRQAAPSKATGVFVDIAKEHRVRNVNGNCGWCALSTIANHQGLHELNGISKGMGGCTSSTVATFLSSCNLKEGVDFKFATDAGKSWALAKEFLDTGRPVLFNTEGHALVCCGYSTTADGKEYVWTIDNTGPHETKVKGWPHAKFDQVHRGWVLGLKRRRPCLPGQCPTTPGLPIPKPRPFGPDVDPSPDLIPTVQPPTINPKPVPPPVIQPSDTKLDKLLERIEEIAKIKAAPGAPGKDGPPGLPGANGKDGRDGKDADGAELIALRKEIAEFRAEQSAQRTALANLQGSFVVEVVPRK